MGFEDVINSDWFKLAYPLLSGVGSAASPGIARGVHGLNTGLVLANQLGAQQQAAEEKRNLAAKLPEILAATKDVTMPKTGLDPAKTTFDQLPSAISETDVTGQPSPADLSATGGLKPPSPLPTYNATEKRPVFPDAIQKLGAALTAAKATGPAMTLIEQELKRQGEAEAAAQKPHYFNVEQPGGGGRGYQIKQGESEASAITPQLPSIEKPYHVGSAEGGYVERFPPSATRPEGSTTQIMAPTPKTPTPLDPLQQENIRSQIGARNSENELRSQRSARLQQAAAVAKDPKATLGQLASWAGSLERQLRSFEVPEEDKPEIVDALRAIRQRVSQMGQATGGSGAELPAPTGTTNGADPLGIRKTKAKSKEVFDY